MKSWNSAFNAQRSRVLSVKHQGGWLFLKLQCFSMVLCECLKILESFERKA
jgi:hypothetical protein